ncbi:MAG TPA: vWA domain-containing protein [Polyangiaceae bacterium]
MVGLKWFAAVASVISCAACSSSDETPSKINTEVESVIIVGTSVTKQIYIDGGYGLTLLPKDAQGKVLLGQGLTVNITIDRPDGFTSVVRDTDCSEPPDDSGLSVGVIIDDSGSMSSSDPDLKRKDAAVAFLDTLSDDDEVLLTDYGATGSNLRDLVCAAASASADCLPSSAGFTDDKAALLAAVEGITASGGTPLYASCRQMVPLVAARKGRKQAILLLSDGQPSDSSLKADCHAAAQAAGIPIFTVGLGPAAENETNSLASAVTVLREIATETSAAYASANDPKELTALFTAVAEALTQGKCDSNALLNEYSKLTVGTRVTGTVSVGDKQAKGTFEFVAPAKN